ncbi:MAG: Zn-dependent exopeptidase M28 [Myxococcales bacterium FL481]|nr:MAG: Zn-dependent exopeptidase M28 [Myxococcales bacterium FL481]
MHNVYATKVGREPSDMYIVSAHMDSINYGAGSDNNRFAPGANDDASGTSLVLEAARVFGSPDVETEVSIRFVLWNNEETGLNGSRAYVQQRASLQGVQDPAGSGEYPEPSWIGVIQHDMMMFDHGLPPGDEQSADADVDIEYAASSANAEPARALAMALLAGNETYASRYPAAVGQRMSSTDSVSFVKHCAAVSLRENERLAEIGEGSNPNWHRSSDVFETYSDEDFLLGFNAAETTVGTVAELTAATVAIRGQ